MKANIDGYSSPFLLLQGYLEASVDVLEPTKGGLQLRSLGPPPPVGAKNAPGGPCEDQEAEVRRSGRLSGS